VALYSYLSEVETFFISVSFLEDEDYHHPELYNVSDDNTKIFSYKLSELQIPLKIDGKLQMYSFSELVGMVNAWYDTYVACGVSPEFDEEKDGEYLKVLRKSSPKNDTSLDQLIEEANNLEDLIDGITKDKKLADLEGRLKVLKDNIKTMLQGLCGENETNISYMNRKYAKSKDSITPDAAKMKKDGIFDKYSLVKPGSWRLTKIEVKESDEV
jgi:hypothetical protein